MARQLHGQGGGVVKLRAKGQSAIWLGVLIAFCAYSECRGAAAQISSNDKDAPTLAEIVERLSEVQRENHLAARSYTVLRNYELVNGKKPENSSEVQAEVSYSPPDIKEYAIRTTSGNGGGERVVRRILDHEVQMASSWQEVALTAENYNFELLGRETVDGHDCFVLRLTPRRDSKDLVRGRAWFDTENFNVRRIEGALKPPSWWLKHVEITMQFSQQMGMWLQTAFIAKADVRFLGEHTLMAHDVRLRTSDDASAGQHADSTQSWPLSGAGSSPAMVGAGVLAMPWHQLR
jgi:hypothetical protein